MIDYIKKNYKQFLYLVALLSLQVAALIISPPENYPIINMISSISGVIAVVMCAEKNIWYFLFAFIQTFSYMFIVYQDNLKLEFGEYLFFYLPTTIWAVFVWLRNIDDGGVEVKPKILSLRGWILSLAITAVSTFVFGTFDFKILGGELPYLDAFTISFTVIAQLLMVFCYREQWLFWVILDVASVITFALLHEPVVTAMYVAWTINCIVGWVMWSKDVHNQSIETKSDLIDDIGNYFKKRSYKSSAIYRMFNKEEGAQ